MGWSYTSKRSSGSTKNDAAPALQYILWGIVVQKKDMLQESYTVFTIFKNWLLFNVVDPDSQASETFCRIRIRRLWLWIQIRIMIRKWTWILLKTIKKIHLKSLALWKSECLGSDRKLDPKLFTSQGGSADPKLGGKWDPDPEKNSFGSTTLLLLLHPAERIKLIIIT
jgi:hypothetical protein